MELANMWVKIGVDTTDFTRSIKTARSDMESFAAKTPKLDGLQKELTMAKAEFEAMASKSRLAGDAVEENQARVDHLTQVLSMNRDAMNELKLKYDEALVSQGAYAEETQNLKLQMLQFEKTQADVSLALREAKEDLEQAEAAARQTGQTFEEAMSGVDAKMELVQAEFEKTAQSMDNFETSAEGLKATSDSLSRQLELQKEKVSLLSDEYERFVSENDASSEAATRLKTQLTQEQTALAGLQKELEKTNSELQKSEGLFGKLKSSMGEAEASSKKLAAGVAAVGAALVAASTKLIKSGIERISMIENSTKAMETMLGSAEEAKVFMDELAEFSRNTPFAFPELAESARNMIAFGMETEKVIPTLTAIGDAVAGMGGGTAEIQAISEAFGKMQTSGRASMEEINSLAAQGIPALQILANQAGVTADEMRSQISSGAIDAKTAIDALVQGIEEGTDGLAGKTAAFGGMMESAQGTWTGALDKFQGAWSRAGEAIMQDHMPAIVEAIGRLTEVLEGLPAVVGPAVDVLVGAFTKLVEFIAGVIDHFANFEDKSFAMQAATVALAGALTAALIPAAVSAGAAISKAIIGVTIALGPWAAVGAAVAAVAFAIYKAWQSNLFGVRDVVQAVGAAIAAVVSWMGDSLSFFGNLASGIATTISEVFNTVRTTVTGVVKDALQWGKDIVQGLIDGIRDKIAAVKKVAGELADSIRGKIQSALEFGSPSKVMIQFGKWVAEGLAQGMQEGKSKVEEAAEKLAQAIDFAVSTMSTDLDRSLDIKIAKLELYEMQLGETADEIEKLNIQNRKLAAESNSLAEQIEILAAAYEKSNKELGENHETTKKYRYELEMAQLELQKLQVEIYDTNNAIKKHKQETVKALQDIGKELRQLAADAESVQKKYRDDLAAAQDEYYKKVADTNRKLREDEKKTTNEYRKALEERTRALSNFVGLFDEAYPTYDVFGAELLENLRGQVDVFETWQEDIAELAARGVDEGLMEELRQMGPKAQPEIAALNTLTDEQLVEYVDLWRRKNQEARKEATKQLKQQKVEMQQKLIEIRYAAYEQLEMYRQEWEQKNAEIRKNADEEMKKIEERFESIAEAGTKYGVDLMANFTAGMMSQRAALERSLQDIATLIDSYMPHSPAKVGPLKRLGEWGPALVNTFADGIRASLPKLENAVAGMAALNPAAVGPSISNSTSNNYGGNVFHIHVSGGSSREQAENLLRELHRRGVRF